MSEIASLPLHRSLREGEHLFGEPVSAPADPARCRYPQTERVCLTCGAVKVTVHGPDGQHWREWRRTQGASEQCEGPALKCTGER
jgi:hypothetical protein